MHDYLDTLAQASEKTSHCLEQAELCSKFMTDLRTLARQNREVIIFDLDDSLKNDLANLTREDMHVLRQVVVGYKNYLETLVSLYARATDTVNNSENFENEERMHEINDQASLLRVINYLPIDNKTEALIMLGSGLFPQASYNQAVSNDLLKENKHRIYGNLRLNLTKTNQLLDVLSQQIKKEVYGTKNLSDLKTWRGIPIHGLPGSNAEESQHISLVMKELERNVRSNEISKANVFSPAVHEVGAQALVLRFGGNGVFKLNSDQDFEINNLQILIEFLASLEQQKQDKKDKFLDDENFNPNLYKFVCKVIFDAEPDLGSLSFLTEHKEHLSPTALLDVYSKIFDLFTDSTLSGLFNEFLQKTEHLKGSEGIKRLWAMFQHLDIDVIGGNEDKVKNLVAATGVNFSEAANLNELFCNAFSAIIFAKNVAFYTKNEDLAVILEQVITKIKDLRTIGVSGGSGINNNFAKSLVLETWFLNLFSLFCLGLGQVEQDLKARSILLWLLSALEEIHVRPYSSRVVAKLVNGSNALDNRQSYPPFGPTCLRDIRTQLENSLGPGFASLFQKPSEHIGTRFTSNGIPLSFYTEEKLSKFSKVYSGERLKINAFSKVEDPQELAKAKANSKDVQEVTSSELNALVEVLKMTGKICPSWLVDDKTFFLYVKINEKSDSYIKIPILFDKDIFVALVNQFGRAHTKFTKYCVTFYLSEKQKRRNFASLDDIHLYNIYSENKIDSFSHVDSPLLEPNQPLASFDGLLGEEAYMLMGAFLAGESLPPVDNSWFLPMGFHTQVVNPYVPFVQDLENLENKIDGNLVLQAPHSPDLIECKPLLRSLVYDKPRFLPNLSMFVRPHRFTSQRLEDNEHNKNYVGLVQNILSLYRAILMDEEVKPRTIYLKECLRKIVEVDLSEEEQILRREAEGFVEEKNRATLVNKVRALLSKIDDFSNPHRPKLDGHNNYESAMRNVAKLDIDAANLTQAIAELKKEATLFINKNTDAIVSMFLKLVNDLINETDKRKVLILIRNFLKTINFHYPVLLACARKKAFFSPKVEEGLLAGKMLELEYEGNCCEHLNEIIVLIYMLNTIERNKALNCAFSGERAFLWFADRERNEAERNNPSIFLLPLVSQSNDGVSFLYETKDIENLENKAKFTVRTNTFKQGNRFEVNGLQFVVEEGKIFNQTGRFKVFITQKTGPVSIISDVFRENHEVNYRNALNFTRELSENNTDNSERKIFKIFPFDGIRLLKRLNVRNLGVVLSRDAYAKFKTLYKTSDLKSVRWIGMIKQTVRGSVFYVHEIEEKDEVFQSEKLRLKALVPIKEEAEKFSEELDGHLLGVLTHLGFQDAGSVLAGSFHNEEMSLYDIQTAGKKEMVGSSFVTKEISRGRSVFSFDVFTKKNILCFVFSCCGGFVSIFFESLLIMSAHLILTFIPSLIIPFWLVNVATFCLFSVVTYLLINLVLDFLFINEESSILNFAKAAKQKIIG